MRAFLSIRFSGDGENRKQMEEVISAIEAAGAQVYCFVKDAEKWGDILFRAEEMMELTFGEINKSDLLIADVSDWPIGVGVEAGYAFAKKIPVICICRMDKRVATTVTGLADTVIRYKDSQHLKTQITSVLARRDGKPKMKKDN